MCLARAAVIFRFCQEASSTMRTANSSISGFMIVRLPNANFDAAGRGAFPSTPPRLGHIFYGGIDRMPWFDVDEALYDETLPPRLRGLRRQLESNDFTGLDLATDLDDLKEMLAFSNRQHTRNEVVALHSAVLAQVKPTFDFPFGDIEWLGFDVAPLGNFSLLLEGLFAHPSLFERHLSALNPFGLLSTEEEVANYVDTYRALSDLGLVEGLVEEPYPVDAIHVGHLSVEGAGELLPGT